MKLTDRILLEWLKKQFTIKHTEAVGSSQELEGPLLYEPSAEWENGWVYVCPEQTDLPQPTGRHHVLLVYACRETDPEQNAEQTASSTSPDPSVPANRSPHVPSIYVCGTVSAILSSLAHAYAYYDAWAMQLQEIQFHMGDASEMLEASLPIFGSPLLLLRRDLTREAYTAAKVKSKEVRKFLSGSDSMDILNAIFQDEHFRASRTKKTPFWGPDYITGFRSLCMQIHKNDTLTYSLIVLEDSRLLTEADGDLLAILSHFIGHALYSREGRGSARSEELRKVLTRVLSDRTFDYLQASRQLHDLGWQSEHRYLCMIYQLTYLNQAALPTASICNHMEEQFSGCSSFLYGSEIVSFFDLDLADQDYDEILAKLRPFIRDSYLKAGYSRVVKGHMSLRRQYIQAEIALDVGSRQKPYIWIHYFDQNAMPYILEQITRRLPADMICHEGLLRLKAHDEEHATEYITTLRTYLDLNQNAVQSAKNLYIHRSTFLYRMDKIREILESELDDPEEILYLSLSLRLLENKDAAKD